MIRTAILSAAITLAAGTASAQSAPQLVGGGDDAAIVYAVPSHNIVGGGAVRLSGGGENRSFSFGAVQAQPGRAATIQGGGLDRLILEQPAAHPALAQSLAGRSRG